MKQLTRVWHPYFLWEETKYNMWGKVENEEKMLKEAVRFMNDTELFGKYMKRVVKEWRYTCEHNLTCSGTNKVAFIGQAACALALYCPAEITKQAWWILPKEKRDAADRKAEEAIKSWYKSYKQNV